LLESFLESLRRRDAAVVTALAAFEIADAIERLQHFLAELGGFAQDGLANIGGGIGKAGQIVVAIDLEDVIDEELHVLDGGFVDRHGVLPASGLGGSQGYISAATTCVSSTLATSIA